MFNFKFQDIISKTEFYETFSKTMSCVFLKKANKIDLWPPVSSPVC